MPLDGKAWASLNMQLLKSFKYHLAVSKLFAKYAG